MNYHNIKTCDLLNGEGARVVLWVSGCQHSCEGCFNKQTWDKNSGIPFTDDAFKEITDALSEPFCNGLTLSGGDPLAPFNYEEILSLCKKVKQMFPEKTIWVYSGFTYDFIKENRNEILN